MSDIVIFEEDARKVEVRLEGETVWLTQEQMAQLFERDRTVVGRHIRNVFREGELEEKSNVQKMHVAGADRPTAFYNLDVIISVGYRVKSQRGVRFRQWTTRVLREHLTQGYSLNEHRLAQQGLSELEQAVELLGRTLTRQALVSDVGQEVVDLILGYARTWRLLQNYDEGSLGLPPGARPARGVLSLEEARPALDALAGQLRERGEASELFARDRGDGLSSILGNLSRPCSASPCTEPARSGRHTCSTS